MEVVLLRPADAGYIAGLVDGEGTITLTRKHRNENRQLALTISSTERTVLEFVKETLGAGKITGKRTVRSHHSPSFTYAVYNRQALQILRQIHPYLRTYKAKRSALILRHYLSLTPRNGKYTDSLRQERLQFEAEVLGIKPG
ncbi:hypothetical protein B1C78_13815 [Thioalkalivibrio denitrificans]|uniref:Homing endonuclease LAGLIDADG domain-containing protein n=1 Tax=Thioalkalivibrio denitrificans TaxID=108003 RepID=A0A1V3NCM8_9GAMM|nr:LAGLIDADG family homing endonuclease [Thioalkalivibrio denitrificans]OOG22830.1 hypothetical protein B1C78_13815 [Thioalkalivibrio denitrificans]